VAVYPSGAVLAVGTDHKLYSSMFSDFAAGENVGVLYYTVIILQYYNIMIPVFSAGAGDRE